MSTKSIHPSQIESELQMIWDSLQGTNKMRACLFNLIIYAEKSQRIAYLNQVIQKMIEKFPSRIIFITYDETCADRDLKTAVSVLSADQESTIFCDLIEIEVCHKDHPRIPFVILPHLLPDLPIYLVDGNDPVHDNPVSNALSRLASRIIFDSAVTDNLVNFAQAVLKKQTETKTQVADLNWARIEGWRELFTAVFRADEDLEALKSTSFLSITYNAFEKTPCKQACIQSIYLQGWFATRLKWQIRQINREGQIFYFHYDNQGIPLQVELRQETIQTLPPGRIISVQIKTSQHITYSLERQSNMCNHITIEKTSPQYCSLPSYFVLDKDVIGHSLVKEICHKKTSLHYINMLKQLTQIEERSLSL